MYTVFVFLSFLSLRQHCLMKYRSQTNKRFIDPSRLIVLFFLHGVRVRSIISQYVQALGRLQLWFSYANKRGSKGDSRSIDTFLLLYGDWWNPQSDCLHHTSYLIYQTLCVFVIKRSWSPEKKRVQWIFSVRALN